MKIASTAFVLFMGCALTLLSSGCGGGGGASGTVTGLQFTVQPTTGAAWSPQTVEVTLRDAFGQPVSGATVTLRIGVNPGQLLVRASHPGGGGPIHLIDPRTPTVLNNISFMQHTGEISGLLWDASSSTLYGCDTGDNLFTVDLTTGAVTVVGAGSTIDTDDYPRGMAPDGMGRILIGSADDADESDIDDLDLATGDSADVGALSIAGDTVNATTGLALDPTTGTMYCCIEPGSGDQAFRCLMTLDLTTLALTKIANLGGGTAVEAPVTDLAFFADGTLYGLLGANNRFSATLAESIVEINKADGTLTTVIALGQGADGEAMSEIPAMFPSGMTLTAVTDASGLASFSGACVNAPGAGYTLIASSAGQTDAESTAFDATAPITSGVVALSAPTSGFPEASGTVTPFSVTLTPSQDHDVFVWLTFDGVTSTAVPPNAANPSAPSADVGLEGNPPVCNDAGRALSRSFYIVIPAGTTSVPVSFALVDDAVVEVDETLIVYIGTDQGAAGSVGLATPGAQLTHTMTITNDD